jgi:hypothetical protein
LGSDSFIVIFEWKPLFGNKTSPKPFSGANGVEFEPEYAEYDLHQPKLQYKQVQLPLA